MHMRGVCSRGDPVQLRQAARAAQTCTDSYDVKLSLIAKTQGYSNLAEDPLNLELLACLMHGNNPYIILLYSSFHFIFHYSNITPK